MTRLRLIHGETSTWTVEGDVGRLHVDAGHGGTARLSLVDGFDVTLRGEVALEDGTRLVQDTDADARVVPLVQAGGVAGLRCQYALKAPDGRFVGDGFAEYWFSDRLRVATGVRVEDDRVAVAGVLVGTTGDVPPVLEGADVVLGVPGAAVRVGTGDTIDPTSSSALAWVRTRPPFYARWMDFVDQWSLDPAAFGFVTAGPEASGDAASVLLSYAAVEPGRRGLLAAGVLDVGPAVGSAGGRGVEGADHVSPSTGIHHVTCGPDGGTVIVKPASAEVVLVEVDGFRPGAVSVAVDGMEAAEVTLVSRAGGVDDPVVPLRRPHDRPADRVVVAARATGGAPVTVEVAPAVGVHAAVQYRDARRRITLHHPDAPTPVAVVETSTGRLLDLRLPGRDVAIADLPLHWLRYLGKSSAHVTDVVEAVEVTSFGPEVVDLTLRSHAAGGRTSSEVRLVMPYHPDKIVLEVTASLRGAAAWRTSTAEFADLFPEVGIDPTSWRYRHVALLRAAGDSVVDMHDPYPALDRHLATPVHVLEAFEVLRGADGDFGPWTVTDGDGVLLHGADAADVVVEIGSVRPADLGQVATYCEHWGDVHLDVVRQGTMPTPTEVPVAAAALPDEITVDYRITLLPASGHSIEAAVRRARREILQAGDA